MRTEQEYEGEVVLSNGGTMCLWFEEINCSFPLPALNMKAGDKVKWIIVSHEADD